MESKAELKPCPFSSCKSAAAPIVVRPHLNSNTFQVVCSKCGSRGPETISEQSAVDEWNRRPADPIIEAAQKVADAYRKWLEPGSLTCHLIDANRVLAALLPAKETNA